MLCEQRTFYFISMHRFSTVFFLSSFVLTIFLPFVRSAAIFELPLPARGSRGHMALRTSNERLSILCSPYVLYAQLRLDMRQTKYMRPKLPDWIRMRCVSAKCV